MNEVQQKQKKNNRMKFYVRISLHMFSILELLENTQDWKIIFQLTIDNVEPMFADA